MAEMALGATKLESPGPVPTTNNFVILILLGLYFFEQ